MKTKIKTIHEEEYSDGSRTIGVLSNYSIGNETWNNSHIYIYREGMYIFFNTIVDMINYLLYGDNTTSLKRKYLKEELFDEYYDSVIEGTFESILESI